MVSENRKDAEPMRQNTTVQWRGDWESFKRRMTAVGIMNGFQQTLNKGEARASIRLTESIVKDEEENWSYDLVVSSERLH